MARLPRLNDVTKSSTFLIGPSSSYGCVRREHQKCLEVCCLLVWGHISGPLGSPPFDFPNLVGFLTVGNISLLFGGCLDILAIPIIDCIDLGLFEIRNRQHRIGALLIGDVYLPELVPNLAEKEPQIWLAVTTVAPVCPFCCGLPLGP
eukprot:gene19826-biopygen6334